MPISSKKPAHMNKPLVSIITPSLNQGKYIEETIQSVLSQTYDNIEYIIMDGGSTDNTIDIIRKYEKDNRLKWLSNRDEGQYDAVNRGFMMARGHILGWINSDDLYTKDTVQKIVDVFNDRSAIDIVYGKLRSFMAKRKHKRIMFTISFSNRWLRRYCFTNPSVTFIKASLIQREGILIDNSIYTFGDWDWFLRMSETSKRFYYLPEILGYFRIQPTSRIDTMNRKRVHSERLLISQRHDIPMSYMHLWVDILIPWFERFQNFFRLMQKREWREIATRLFDNSSKVFRNVLGT